MRNRRGRPESSFARCLTPPPHPQKTTGGARAIPAAPRAGGHCVRSARAQARRALGGPPPLERSPRQSPDTSQSEDSTATATTGQPPRKSVAPTTLAVVLEQRADRRQGTILAGSLEPPRDVLLRERCRLAKQLLPATRNVVVDRPAWRTAVLKDSIKARRARSTLPDQQRGAENHPLAQPRIELPSAMQYVIERVTRPRSGVRMLATT